MGRNQYGEWMTEQDINFIKDNYNYMTNIEIAKVLGRCEGSIKTQLRKLGLKKRRVFTKEDIDFMKENYMKMSYGDIAKKINISQDLVKSKILKELKLKKRETIPHYYTKEENEFIIKNYLNMKNKELAYKLGVDTDSIHNQLTKLKIARDFRWNKERASNWRGGIMFEPYDSNFHPNFKQLIKQREGFLCLKCGMREEDAQILFKKKLTVHHIDYNKKLSIKENCCCLCNRCHGEVNYNRNSWIVFFQSLLSERYGYVYDEGKILLNFQGEQNGKN